MALTLRDFDNDGTLNLAVANANTTGSIRLNPAIPSPCANDTQAPTVRAAGFAINLVNGQATIQPEDVDGGSYDNCGDVSLALDKSSFTCANVGLNPVTLIVTDKHGNVARQAFDILVRGDGTCTTPAITGDQLNVYPNPVVNSVRLRISDLTTGALVTVYNGQGTRVLTQALASTDQSIDLSALPTGVYLLKVNTGSQVITQRVIKN